MRWRPGRTPRDFGDEIRAHLELEADELIRSGMSEREAREAARRRFGNVGAAEERFYESVRVMWLDRLRRDAAYAVRALRLSPVYSLAALSTLALGIGVTTTVFSLVYALGMRRFPVRDAERVVTVYQEFSGSLSRRVYGSRFLLSQPEYVEYRDGSRVFEGLAAYAEADLALAGSGAPSHVQFASCNYFGVMRARLVAGRGFAPDECAGDGESPVAVVSHEFWQRTLDADPAAIGRTIRIGPRAVTVIGVAEPDFRGTEPQAPALWLPLPMHASLLPGAVDARDRDLSWLTVVGRLKPTATVATARADLAPIARRMDAERPGRVTTLHVDVGTFGNEPEMRRTGIVVAGALGAIAALVLLMACVNVTSLSLSRAVARRREIGVRLALGAGRPRLVWQLLTESVVLALCGGVPGVALLAALASGLAPALQATRLDLTEALKGDGRVGTGGGAARLRRRLVGAQVAGSLLLLVMSGLLLRGVRHARTMDPGFATRGVIALTLDLGAADYSSERAAVLYATLVDRLGALPGVQSVALAQSLPLVGRGSTYVTPADGDAAAGVPASFAVVSGTYLSTMGIPLVRGRAFTDTEARGAGARPVVVSTALARRLWGAGEALGMRLRDQDGEYYVVGVASDVHNVSLAERDGAFLYVPVPPDDPRGMKIIVRERARGGVAPAAVNALVAALDGSVPAATEVFADRLARMLAPARTAAAICGAIGLLATLLALLGVYGVASYNASRRAREIAVRIALGAMPRDVLALVLGDGARPVIIGLAAGALFAAGAARLVRGVLFGVSALDPAVFVGAVVLLGSAAFLAMYWPARGAAGVEPAVALRGE